MNYPIKSRATVAFGPNQPLEVIEVDVDKHQKERF
jgi:Zn-dependent alcohol dehydrogenase